MQMERLEWSEIVCLLKLFIDLMRIIEWMSSKYHIAGMYVRQLNHGRVGVCVLLGTAPYIYMSISRSIYVCFATYVFAVFILSRAVWDIYGNIKAY